MNAGLLAVRMLGGSIPAFAERMEAYMHEMEQGVYAKVERLRNEGWDYALPGK